MEKKQEDIEYVKVPKVLVSNIADYLWTRPCAETFQFIEALRTTVKLLEKPKKEDKPDCEPDSEKLPI